MYANLPVASAGLSDRGRVREVNEDGFVCEPALGLFAVADGLGGLPCGEFASRLTLDELVREVRALPREAEPDWQAIFTRINLRVQAEGRRLAPDTGMGSTLTAVRALPGRLSVGHVGDSGLCAFDSSGRWTRLTRDQTLAQEMLDAQGPGVADSIPDHYHHTLTQCMGQPVDLVVETCAVPTPPGSCFLLYSDGVTKTQKFGELAAAIASSPNPKALVTRIVDLANARGGPDNTTAVAIFY